MFSKASVTRRGEGRVPVRGYKRNTNWCTIAKYDTIVFMSVGIVWCHTISGLLLQNCLLS